MKKKKKEKNKFNFKEEYSLCFDYIKESKNFIFIIIGIFLLFMILAMIIPTPKIISEKIFEFIKEILNQTKNMSHLELIRFIMFNNLKSTFLALSVGSILIFFPIIVAIANGYLLGFISLITIKQEGILGLWRLMPHGIFEFPAIFISLGLGLRFGTFLFNKNSYKIFKEYLFKSIRVFLLIILPLLIIAGIIEGTLIFLS